MTSRFAHAWKVGVTLLAAESQLNSLGPFTVPFESDVVGNNTLNTNIPLQKAIEVLPPAYTNILEGSGCSVPLMNHTFGFSYGKPFVGKFEKPDCAPEKTMVYLKWVAQCPMGRQFDRIAAVWVNGVELLRTSTQEPKRTLGVEWEVVKDVTNYYDIFQTGGQLVVSLDNVVDTTYTSSFSVQLYAEFYEPKDPKELKKPDAIIPLSASSNYYGWFTVEPSSKGKNKKQITVPTNVEELYLELFLSHHGCDEFWYTNPPTKYANATGNECGNGAFREVQVLIDGEFVGAIWPFPLIFTGGICPYLWRPIVSIGAFIVPTYLLNLTPFLPKVLDGKPHEISFQVDQGISMWLIDGNLLAYLDKNAMNSKNQTKAKILQQHFQDQIVPEIHEQIDPTNLDATFQTIAKRNVFIQTSITTSKGTKIYTLTQKFEFKNTQVYTLNATMEKIQQTTKISTEMLIQTTCMKTIEQIKIMEIYPLEMTSLFQNYKEDEQKNFRLYGDLDHGYIHSLIKKDHPQKQQQLQQQQKAFRYNFQEKSIEIFQQANAWMDSKIGGNGTTSVQLEASQQKDEGHCYARQVLAVNGTLSYDHEEERKCSTKSRSTELMKVA
jgi:hypothetical protein